jgi:two-component system, cell cycle response regulator
MIEDPESGTALPLKKPERILVVDDEPLFRNAILGLLADYTLAEAGSGEEALRAIQEQIPTLVLLDMNMPDMTGLEVISRLRKDARTANLPVILVTSADETDCMVDAFGLGATDYILKPVRPRVLLARVKAHLREAALRSQLEMQNAMLMKLAAFDDLTGAYNRRAMMGMLEHEIGRSHRYGSALSVAMMDLDEFSEINEAYGHAVGDQVLRWFVHRTAGSLRTTDLLCRYGGEEFCLVMPETDLTEALAAADRIRAIVGEKPFLVAGMKLRLTVSAGVACLPPDTSLPADGLVDHAERALNQAKRAGRNRVSVSAYGYTGSEDESETG